MNNDFFNEFRFSLTEFEKYRVIQDRLFQSDFDSFLQLEGNLKEDNDKNKKKSDPDLEW